MTQRQLVEDLVSDVLGQINGTLPEEATLAARRDTPLYGGGGPLDSLGVIDLVMLLERGVAEKLGLTVSLAEHASAPRSDNPLRSVGALVDYLCTLTEPKKSAA
ncbi:MAG: acyl carrier protein [Planctomycetota bacterium]|jgi:acyl carrier protein